MIDHFVERTTKTYTKGTYSYILILVTATENENRLNNAISNSSGAGITELARYSASSGEQYSGFRLMKVSLPSTGSFSITSGDKTVFTIFGIK